MITGLILFVLGVGFIVYMFKHDSQVKQSDKYKEAVAKGTKPRKLLIHRKWWVWVLIVFVVLAGIGEMTGVNDDDNDSESTAPKTHKVQKKSKPAAKKKSASKTKSKGTSKKENAELLATALHALPKKTHGEIQSAKIADDHMDIKIVLSDDLVDSMSDAALRKTAKQAWEIGTNYAHNFGPYPDGYFDRDACPVYILDSAGNELGKSTMFGDFKWEG